MIRPLILGSILGVLTLTALPARSDVLADFVSIGDSIGETPGRTTTIPTWTDLLADQGCETSVAKLAVGSVSLAEVNRTQARQVARFAPKATILTVAWEHDVDRDGVWLTAVELNREYGKVIKTLRQKGVQNIVIAGLAPHARAGWQRHNALAREVNALLAARDGIVFVSTDRWADRHGKLRRAYDSGDGVHWSRKAYDFVLADALDDLRGWGVCAEPEASAFLSATAFDGLPIAFRATASDPVVVAFSTRHAVPEPWGLLVTGLAGVAAMRMRG